MNKVSKRIILVISVISIYTVLHTKGKNMLTLASSSFKDGSEIPSKYTCKGENISPQLYWQPHPDKKIKSYALIVDDPDAQPVVGKTFVHWIVLLSNEATELAEGASSSARSHVPGIELPNDFGTTHYGGPCPPKGTGVHTYRFTLFALSQSTYELQQDPNFPTAPFTAEQFKDSLKQHIIDEARMSGMYEIK